MGLRCAQIYRKKEFKKNGKAKKREHTKQIIRAWNLFFGETQEKKKSVQH